MDTIHVAVIQASSVFADKAASIAKTVDLIAEAGKQGAQLIVFPETLISGYPRGFSYGAYIGSRSLAGREDFARFWKSSTAVTLDETKLLRDAAKNVGAYVVVGISEKGEAGNHGTLYNSLLYLSPDGDILGTHRKLMPTATERLIWGAGDGSTLTTIDTAYGTVGGLICWENYMPLARMSMYGKGVNIYLAPTADARDTWQSTLRHIACEGRCFVLGCNQYFTKSMYPTDLALYDELADLPEEMCRGGSAIVDPFGDYVCQPLYGREGMLIAELDLNKIHQGHLDFDVVGHYHRPDVFKFTVNEAPNPALNYSDDSQ
ncbi:MAG: carbon-nitrogen hydrolase family protein [Anaerolineae bacterium]|nr:carbon-nitrogen hydrolase family protein [Anaerolineae bacterium]MDQ7036132.1 carbon-nitrogen hydrolase family protein [Anaerolineae bacterium]